MTSTHFFAPSRHANIGDDDGVQAAIAHQSRDGTATNERDRETMDSRSGSSDDGDSSSNDEKQRCWRDVCGRGVKSSFLLYTEQIYYRVSWIGKRRVVCALTRGDDIMRYATYSSFSARLSTFFDREPVWQQACPFVTPHDMARAGFFRDRNAFDDSATCFSCGLILHQWRPRDVPLWEHVKHSNGRCGFAFKMLLREQLSCPWYDDTNADDACCADACCADAATTYSCYVFGGIDDNIVLNRMKIRLEGNDGNEKLYHSERNRVLSFAHFDAPSEKMPHSKLMARSGLYYNGQGDEARCFACKCVFANWTKHSDPKRVHSVLSPHCTFFRATEADWTDDDAAAALSVSLSNAAVEKEDVDDADAAGASVSLSNAAVEKVTDDAAVDDDANASPNA